MKKVDSYGLQKKTKAPSQYALIYLVFMFFLGCISLQVATQYIAYKYQYHQALGGFFFIAFGYPIYPFWKCLTWNANFENTVIIKQGLSYARVLFVMPQCVLLTLLLFFKKPKGNSTLHGSARFANEIEIKNMGYLNGEGVYVGGFMKDGVQYYLRHNGSEHVLVFAPTRSGKGVGLILPTLLSWLASSIVLDIKGENWALTAGFKKSLGHKVFRFDPTDTTGSACRFNPLEEINLDSLEAVQEVQNLASMIIDADGKGLHDHWSKSAFAFFGGVLLHCCIMFKVHNQRTATMQDLSLMMSGFGYDEGLKSLLTEMVETEHTYEMQKVYPHMEDDIGEELHAFIASSAKEMLSKADGEASGVVSTALANLALYKDPIINLNTKESDFRINDLMNHDVPVNLYLVLSPNSIDRVRPLIRLMVDMIIRKTCKEMAFKDGTSVKGYKHRLLMMFDEFTSLGKLPIIERSIPFSAGYGVKNYLIVQDITQLNAVYGKDNALMANCHVRIAYAPNTIETAKVLSEMTGKTTVVERKKSLSYSKHGRSSSENISEVARPLLTPDECMRLPSAIKDKQGNIIEPGHMLIFTAGQSPIYGVQILYFRDPVFIARAKIAVPGISEKYPNGITDSIYTPRPEDWYINEPKSVAKDILKPPTISLEKPINFEDYLE